MDLTTLIGLGAGALLLLLAMTGSGSVRDFVDLTSLVVTLGGTCAAALVHYPLPRLKQALAVVREGFKRPPGDNAELAGQLVGYAEQARWEGVLVLEDEAEKAEDPFLRQGLQLLVDGLDPADVRAILESDLTAYEVRQKQGTGLLESMAQYAPAFGMIGTLIGLVKLLKGMSDTAALGAGMGFALLATLYGVLLANFVLQPLAGKLKVRTAEEVRRREAMIEALLAIQAGETPTTLAARLQALLGTPVRPDRRRRDEEG